MASTTYTSSAVKSVTFRNIHQGVFASVVSFAYTATISASNTFLMVPIPDRVTILDGWVFSNHSSSGSFLIHAGWPGDTSLFIATTSLDASTILRFAKGLPHQVTMTDSDSFPRSKPLTITVQAAASGTLVGSPALTVMVMMENL